MLAVGLLLAELLAAARCPHVDLDRLEAGVFQTTDATGEYGAAGVSVVGAAGAGEDGGAVAAVGHAGAGPEEEALGGVVLVSQPGEVGAGGQLLAFSLAGELVMGVLNLGQDRAGGGQGAQLRREQVTIRRRQGCGGCSASGCGGSCCGGSCCGGSCCGGSWRRWCSCGGGLASSRLEGQGT